MSPFSFSYSELVIEMDCFRITKYDPSRRQGGGQSFDEWTSISDIGRSYVGTKLTKEEYLRVEDAYVRTAICLWNRAGRPKLSLLECETYTDLAAVARHLALQDGTVANGVTQQT